MRPSSIASALLSSFTLLVCAYLVMPTLAVAPLSITRTDFVVFPPQGFSLRWYAELFTSDAWRSAMWNSFITATLTMAIATPVGTMLALGMARLKGPLAHSVNIAVLLPIIVPSIVIAVAMYGLLARANLIGTIPGLVLAHTVLALPFVVINVTAIMRKVEPRIEQAARSLGATPLKAFRLVVLPQLIPGIAAGALFAFLISFDDVVIALFVSGVSAVTLPVQMWSGIRFELSPVVAAASTVLLVMSCLLMMSVQWIRARRI